MIFVVINLVVDLLYSAARSARPARRGEGLTHGGLVTATASRSPELPPEPVAPATTGETPLRRLVSRVLREPGAVAGLVVLVAARRARRSLAPWISPQNPYDLAQLDIMDNVLPPGDELGGRHHVSRSAPTTRAATCCRRSSTACASQPARRRHRRSSSRCAHRRRRSALRRGLCRRPGRGAAHAHRRPAAVVPGDPGRADPARRPRARASTRS